MPFRKDKIRLEQFSVEAQYHAAYNFLSLKGVVAERWAHGPVFGAFSEGSERVVLTPDDNGKRIRGIYGLRSAALRCGWGVSATEAATLGVEWIGDVYGTLAPRRTVGLSAQWFSLYPLAKPDGPSAKLRDRFYQRDRIADLKPKGFDQWLSAVEGMVMKDHEQQHLSYRIGAVGPLHAGSFFIWPDETRDSSWWMGVRTSLVHRDEDGIAKPVDDLSAFLNEGRAHHEHVLIHALPAIVD